MWKLRLPEKQAPKILWPRRCLDFLMFSNVTSENNVGLLRLPGNEKWRDALGKQPRALTHSQGEEAGEEEESGRQWVLARADVSDRAWRGLLQYSVSPALDWRENTRALNRCHEAGQPPPLAKSWPKQVRGSTGGYESRGSLRLFDSGHGMRWSLWVAVWIQLERWTPKNPQERFFFLAI